MTTPRQIAARKVCDLLGHVAHSLDFYLVSGRNGIDCSREALEAIQQWDRPGCLATEKSAAARKGCDACPLASSGAVPVHGQGPTPARLMVISDSPLGAGDPFAGSEGELFTRILSAMELAPDRVFVTAMVRCPVPENAKSAPRALAACRFFLEEEIRRVQPAVIWVMGETAAQALLGADDPLDHLRGRFHAYQNISVMPTWHPRDILADPSLKRPVWEDVQQIMKFL